MMSSYFRSWFGGSSSQSTSKSHSRSKSASNIYAATGSTPGAPPPRPDPTRNHSYSTTHSAHSSHSHSAAPSPLRYATNTTDTRTAYGYGRRGSSSSHTSDLRPQVLRRASHKPKGSGECSSCQLPRCALTHILVLTAPIYTPSAAVGQFTPSSSRSNSNSSMFTSMSGAPYGTSRSDSGHHTPYSHTRPPLTSNDSWQTGSVGSTSSCTSPRLSARARRAVD